MNIVVTNDDGLHTRGIWKLAEALCQVGTVSVVAPDREQSGVGMGISFHHPVRVSEAISRIEGVKALLVEGTPADSVILAVQGLTPKPVDLVVSGINEGANTGINVLVSGTVGAAFQAHLWDVPAIAISVATIKDAIFEPAAKLAQILAGMFRDKVLSGPMLLNVNLPNVPLNEIDGVEITRLARGRYENTLEKIETAKYDYYWVARGKADWKVEEGTDIAAVRQRKISITPLHIDMTSSVATPLLNGFGKEIYQAFRGGL